MGLIRFDGLIILDYLSEMAYPMFTSCVEKITLLMQPLHMQGRYLFMLCILNSADPSVWIRYLQVYIDLHNDMIHSVAQLLSLESLQAATWPCREIVEQLSSVEFSSKIPSLSWNSLSNLKRRETIVKKFLLPNASAIALEDYQEHVRTVLVHFRTYLKSLVPSLPSDLQSTLIRQLALVLSDPQQGRNGFDSDGSSYLSSSSYP